MPNNLERIPPHNKEAEISVLGSVLIDGNVFLDVAEILDADDFYEEAHKEIYRAIKELHLGLKPVDLVTVAEELNRRHSLEAIGGRSYIAHLADAVPTSANAKEYAKIVHEKAELRSLISIASDIVKESYNEAVDAERILDSAEQDILAIAQRKQTSNYSEIGDVLTKNLEQILEAQKNGGQIPGLTTGFKTLDNKIKGLAKSEFIIVAARPSMGKTAFALNIAQNAALKANAHVVIFSLEMSKELLGLRLLSMEARVDSQKLKVGDVSTEDIEDINNAINKLSKANIEIDDTPGIGVMEIRNKCRRLAAKRPIDLIVIDYLQMMTMGASIENRQQEVSNISRYLKQLAREMKCPVVCLSQLSRAVEQRQGNHRPILSDLRESGAIEQDADIVMFLYRDDYYKDKDAPASNTCDIIIAKNRTGETGVCTLTWLPRFTKFADKEMEQRYDVPANDNSSFVMPNAPSVSEREAALAEDPDIFDDISVEPEESYEEIEIPTEF